MIAEFGSLDAAMRASPERQRRVLGQEGAHDLQMFRALVVSTITRRLDDRPIIKTLDVVLDLLHLELAYVRHEIVQAVFLDRRDRLISLETIGSGTIDEVPIYPRELLTRALELGATSIILAHNHPSGDLTPSRADIELTTFIERAGAPLGIHLLDHLIIGPGGHVSVKQHRHS